MEQFAGVAASDLLPFVAVGFVAQIVDGALGMAFGVICTTLLVAVIGLPPARASANVHIAETVTTAISGLSHFASGNVDRRLFLTVVLSATFILKLGVKDFAVATIGLLIGGVLAAPFGAVLARRIPAKRMLPLVGLVLAATSTYGFVLAVL